MERFDVKSALMMLGYKIDRAFPNANLTINYPAATIVIEGKALSLNDANKFIKKKKHTDFIIFTSVKLDCTIIKILTDDYAKIIFDDLVEELKKRKPNNVFYLTDETEDKLALIDNTEQLKVMRITKLTKRVNVQKDTDERLMIIFNHLTKDESDEVKEGYSDIGKLI